MKKNRVFGGVLLVSGTAIGAGMIALPVTSGSGGLVPTLILLLSCWLYMTTTAFLFLEATLWLERDVNIVTMAEHTLGWVGKIISWFLYLFLLYSLTTAYLSGCGAIFINSIQAWAGILLPQWAGPIPFLILFGLCIYLGTRPSDYINRALMLGLVLTYSVLGAKLTPKIQGNYLLHSDWKLIWPSIAIMVTSFGYHIIIPSLSYYLGYRKDLLKKTLIWGSLLPLFVYVLFEVLVLGVVPFGGLHGLVALSHSTHPEVDLISTININAGGSNIGEVLRFFVYFAILTSFLGVSLSLHDFLADGLKIEKTSKGRFFLTLITFLPPLCFALFFPNVFVSALKFGAIFVAALLGILPAVMVWSGRYKLKMENKFRVIGGKGVLVGVILISLIVIVMDVIDQI
ncbi:MAG: Tyrosine-specific transport protein [Chlamydiae bacterium]|nr:Tyrosine-specific transport protein [Chlamydiota bacterium]